MIFQLNDVKIIVALAAKLVIKHNNNITTIIEFNHKQQQLY